MIKQALTVLLLTLVLLITGCGRSITLKTDNVTIIHNDDQTLLSDGDNELMIAGASVAGRTIVVPNNRIVAHTDTSCLRIWDTATGDLVDDTTGITGATWAGSYIDFTAHANNSVVWTVPIPPLDTDYEYAMAVFADITTTTISDGPWLYYRGKVYTDTNMIWDNAVLTKGKPHNDDDYILND